MTGSAPATRDVPLAAVEERYRRLVRRWYPRAWVAANGDALVGTLLDVAEHRGRTALSPAAVASIASHGVVLRMATVLDRDVRARSASIGVGAALGYSLVAARTSIDVGGWALPALHQSAHLWGLLPFLAGWILAAVLAFAPNRRVRAAGLGAAVLITIATSGAWYSGGLVELGRGLGGWLSWTSYHWPGTVSTVVLLAGSGALALLARPRLRDAAMAAIGTIVVVAVLEWVVAGGLVLPTPDWFWSPDWMYFSLPVPILGLLAAVLLASIGLVVRRRRRIAIALVIATSPWLLAWIFELLLRPQVLIPY